MVHLPSGIPGWTVFLTGLLLIAYRVHGIDAPRAWIEWVEARFTAKRTLQFAGGIIALLGVMLASLSPVPEGFVGWLFVFSIALFVTLGIALAATQNHVRMLVVATAEAEDKQIRIASIVLTVLGLLWALVPWFV